MHISDAPLSQRKEDGEEGGKGSGEGTKAKLKIKWCDLHYKSITLWHLHIVYLCNSKIFFYQPPISIWVCINMYKSLLREKNRIPCAALESLKGALSCFNFSCAYKTVSISFWRVFFAFLPHKKGTDFKHFSRTSGKKDPRSRLGLTLRGKGLKEAMSGKRTTRSLCGMKTVIEDKCVNLIKCNYLCAAAAFFLGWQRKLEL